MSHRLRWKMTINDVRHLLISGDDLLFIAFLRDCVVWDNVKHPREVFRWLKAGFLQFPSIKVWGTRRFQNKLCIHKYTHYSTFKTVIVHQILQRWKIFKPMTLDNEVLRLPIAAHCTLVINTWSDMLIMPICFINLLGQFSWVGWRGFFQVKIHTCLTVVK